MYDTYMSDEEFNQLKVGDKVTIRHMDDLCGDTLTVESVVHQPDGSTIVYVDEGWILSPEIVEPSHVTGISQEEMTTMWEKMILGGNNDKE